MKNSHKKVVIFRRKGLKRKEKLTSFMDDSCCLTYFAGFFSRKHFSIIDRKVQSFRGPKNDYSNLWQLKSVMYEEKNCFYLASFREMSIVFWMTYALYCKFQKKIIKKKNKITGLWYNMRLCHSVGKYQSIHPRKTFKKLLNNVKQVYYYFFLIEGQV